MHSWRKSSTLKSRSPSDFRPKFGTRQKLLHGERIVPIHELLALEAVQCPHLEFEVVENGAVEPGRPSQGIQSWHRTLTHCVQGVSEVE